MCFGIALVFAPRCKQEGRVFVRDASDPSFNKTHTEKRTSSHYETQWPGLDVGGQQRTLKGMNWREKVSHLKRGNQCKEMNVVRNCAKEREALLVEKSGTCDVQIEKDTEGIVSKHRAYRATLSVIELIAGCWTSESCCISWTNRKVRNHCVMMANWPEPQIVSTAVHNGLIAFTYNTMEDFTKVRKEMGRDLNEVFTEYMR